MNKYFGDKVKQAKGHTAKFRAQAVNALGIGGKLRASKGTRLALRKKMQELARKEIETNENKRQQEKQSLENSPLSKRQRWKNLATAEAQKMRQTERITSHQANLRMEKRVHELKKMALPDGTLKQNLSSIARDSKLPTEIRETAIRLETGIKFYSTIMASEREEILRLIAQRDEINGNLKEWGY